MLFTHLIFGTEKVYGRGELVRSCAALAASARTGNHQPMRVEGFVFSLGIVLRMRQLAPAQLHPRAWVLFQAVPVC